MCGIYYGCGVRGGVGVCSGVGCGVCVCGEVGDLVWWFLGGLCCGGVCYVTCVCYNVSSSGEVV